MRATLFAAPLVGAIGLAAFAVLHAGPTESGPAAAAKTDPALPLSHVVLFSSGVGYFQREGEVTGSARVDLAFPVGDVNDLVKSLVLQDTGGGRVTTVNYDGPDPIERTLRTFALDLTANPSLGQVINQARGEKVEVTLQQSANAAGGTLIGMVLGMESKLQSHGKDQMVDEDYLNLVCAEGLRSVKLTDVLRLRFLNPALDAELHRALDLIAGGRDHQKKTVSLAFKGDGKRLVKVGYVVESPVWKTTYRLALGPDSKAALQGWALVENTTDDDWNGVKMALVSGRPISFQMDLYQPLYVPRPTVEPERFASLRPPMYTGPITNQVGGGSVTGNGQGFAGALGGLAVAGGGGGIAGAGQPGNAFNGAIGFGGGSGQANLGFGGGAVGFGGGNIPFNRYQPAGQVGNPNPNFNNTQVAMDDGSQPAGRLTFEQLKERQKQLQEARGEAQRVGASVACLDPADSVASIASAAEIGDVCHYRIDDPVTLPRQKSAMLPIVTQPVEAAKVSIFNEAVHAKFPLLGVRFKNTATQPLMQGPVTVYVGGAYAGDSRVQDLQPGEERLLSYAIDTGTEVKVEMPTHPTALVAVKAVHGVLHATHRLQRSKVYLIRNHSRQDRTLVIEHPYTEAWTLVTPERPTEKARDVYRFQVAVKAGQAVRHEVVEEQRRPEIIRLNSAGDPTIELFLISPAVGPKLKEALSRVRELNAKLTATRRDLFVADGRLHEITADQGRLRANFEKVPPTSAAYKRYLEKFDQQETEIEKLQAEIKARQATEKAQQKDLDNFLAGLTIDG
jgi:hypothetical protein